LLQSRTPDFAGFPAPFPVPGLRRALESRTKRQPRRIAFKVDTDGDCRPSIPLYRELGLNAMVPFEVASHCDVVAIGRDYPWLVWPDRNPTACDGVRGCLPEPVISAKENR
jgi:hypothetical protein